MSTLQAENATSTMTSPTTSPRWRRYYTWAAVGGVLVVPLVLTLAFNSWSAPDDAAFVRMAFAQVASGTIAVATMLALVVVSLVKHTKNATPVLIVVAVIISQYWFVSLSNAVTTLLERIG